MQMKDNGDKLAAEKLQQSIDDARKKNAEEIRTLVKPQPIMPPPGPWWRWPGDK
jgi:hypothetical protein